MIGPRLDGGLAVAWFGLLALLATWPVVLDPIHQVIGHHEASVGCHLWVIWWAQHHLGEFATPLIFYPYGADVVQLYGSDALSPLLLGRLPLPPALLYNAWVILLLVAGALGARRLAVSVGASPGGGLVAGTVFMTAPFFLHEMLNGTSEILAAAVLPWFAWIVLQLLDRPSPWRGVGLGLTTWLAAATSAYNLFFLVVVGCCILGHRLATRGAPVLTPAVWRAGSVGVGVAAALGAPLAWLQLRHGAAATLSRREDWLEQDPPLPDSFVDGLDWFDPRAADIPALMARPDGLTFEYWTTCTAYLGFAALVLAALGWWRGRRSPGWAAGPFLVMIVVGGLLAMGPVLRVGGEVMTVMGVPLYLPAITVAELFPPFVLTALHAYRYTAVVVLGLAVLAGLGARRAPLAVLVAAEALWVSPVPWPAAVTPVPDSPVLAALADAPPGGVLTVPMEGERLGHLGRMLIAQTQHGHPIHDGGIHRRAGASSLKLFEDNPLVRGTSAYGGPKWPDQPTAAYGIVDLQEKGYRYVLAPAEDAATLAEVSALLGAPVDTDPDWVRWDLGGASP